MPDGTFTSDPGAAIQPVPGRPGLSRTAADPQLVGIGNGPTYDWKVGRWLPVSSQLVSPDGLAYVYAETIPNPANHGGLAGTGPPPLGTRVHLVDIRSASDTVIYQTTDLMDVADYRADGIYLEQPVMWVDTTVPFYIWDLDPTTHDARRILGGTSVGPRPFYIESDVLWTADSDPSDPASVGATELVRVDLQDGRRTKWLQQPATSIDLIGVDSASRPLVTMSTESNGRQVGDTYVVTGPMSAQAISDEMFNDETSDSHGSWLSGNGVFFHPIDGPTLKVAPDSGWVLGACQ